MRPEEQRHFLDLLNVVKDYRLFVQMIKDKRYTIPVARKLVYFLLTVYIIVPFDFIPGIFPLIGIVDDLGALAAIVGVLLYEISAYRDFLDGILNRSGSPGKGEEKLIDGKASSGGKTKKSK
jgi:uncharacterized membrane protein YkvA (DUF1232 family)